MTWWGDSAKLGKQTAEQSLTQENISLPGCHLTPQSCAQGSFGSCVSEKNKSNFQRNTVLQSVNRNAFDNYSHVDFLLQFSMKTWLIWLIMCQCVAYTLFSHGHHTLSNPGSAPSYLLYLATWRYLVLGYFTEPLPVAVITCLGQQWHLHARCLVPTV